MTANPYRWQHDHPAHFVARDRLVTSLEDGLRGGLALKLIGGRGMGKSALLRQVKTRFASEPTTRVVLVSGPAEGGTPSAFVQDIAAHLGLAPLSRPAMDEVMDLASQKGIERLILLLDEADQYVLLGGGEVARIWFNRLEAARKAWPDRIGIVVAGGLGLLHLAHVLGSGLLSRADSFIASPFDLPELRELASPFARRGAPLGEDVIETLAVLSGGNPALATFGLQKIWAGGDPIAVLRSEFGSFPLHHADFLRAVQDSVSHRGLVQAPGRVLALVRKHGASVSREQLIEACAADTPHVDLQQALQLLEAAGLVRVSGSPLGGPLEISPVSSVINLPTASSGGANAPEQLLSDVISLLGNIHRFGRDFHGPKGLLEEQVFSSILAVGLAQLGWYGVSREPVQAAGYLDLRVSFGSGERTGHALFEIKIWPRNDYTNIQEQVDSYRTSDTVVAIAVMLGSREVKGWKQDYEQNCLAGLVFSTHPDPPDLVGRWSAKTVDGAGVNHETEHLLVHIPKRS